MLRTAAEYEDFRLTFEYKLDQWAEAAVILRALRTAHRQHAGLALVLTHDFLNESTPHITGALPAVRPPQWKMPEAETWGRWHRVEIELRGVRLARLRGAPERLPSGMSDTLISCPCIPWLGNLLLKRS